MILVDLSGIVYGHIVNEKLIVQEDLIRHTILNTLRSLNAKFRDKYGQIVLCCDGGSWREDVMPEYKWGRKQNRAAPAPTEPTEDGEILEPQGMDWVEIFRIVNNLQEEFKQFLQWPVIQVRKCEADDIIAIMALFELQQASPFSKDVLIISRDRDFFQLHRQGIEQWDPFSHKFVRPDKNAKFDLFVKCVKGDGGDGVPNILAPQDFFVQKAAGKLKRQPTISTKKLDDWFLNGVPAEYIDRYQMNRKVVALAEGHMPQHLVTAILEQIAQQNQKTNQHTLNYLISKNCRNLIEKLTDF